MGEGADDLRKDLSPARLYLEMLGKQLDQMELSQTDADRRHHDLQTGQAELVTQMLQKVVISPTGSKLTIRLLQSRNCVKQWSIWGVCKRLRRGVYVHLTKTR